MTFSEELKRTEKIMQQYIYCKIKRKFTEKVEKEVVCLLDLSDEFLQAYKLTFAHIVKNRCTDPAFYYAISDETLQEESLNWGRFASLYALAGELAIKYEQENDTKMIENIITWLQIATVKNLLWIINSGGGWDGFLELFDKTQQRKRRAFTYFVYISVFLTSPFFMYSLCKKYM